MNDKVKKCYDLLYEYLNYTSTGLDLDGNKIHLYFDGFGEFDIIIDPNSIELF